MRSRTNTWNRPVKGASIGNLTTTREDMLQVYVSATGSKYISDAIQLILNTGLYVRDGPFLQTKSHRHVPAHLADCRCDACHYRVCGHLSSAWTLSFSIPCCRHSSCFSTALIRFGSA